MLQLSILGLFMPLMSSLFLVASSSIIGRRLTALVACSSVALSLSCFVTLLVQANSSTNELGSVFLFHWIPVDGINADFSLYLDSLSLLMTLIVTGVGFLIHVYAIGYMDHDRNFARFFACLNFFVFAMLLLVLAQHLLLLFVGWEGVGLASYLLIGFWYDRPSAASAATKAFVINRIGDLGLLLGLLLTLYLFGTTDIPQVLSHATREFSVGAPILTLLTMLYFVGAVGKSAQLPLHVWLPDAMEGPTPVSALIHAATMVTAGVYLLVRLAPLYQMVPEVLYGIGVIGGATALFAALCALAQSDLKRVLAYSTVSQLGLMFVACGTGSFFGAMFHLTTHAFAKALLFLCAGNVVHMLNGTTDMKKMGGLAKKLPKTHACFLLGVLAMSGIPPLAPFFSKDLIIEEAYRSGFNLLYSLTVITSLLTAFYLGRAYFLTFHGTSTKKSPHPNAVEAPWVMTVPILVLGLLTISGGALGLCWGEVEIPLLARFLAFSSNAFHVSVQVWISLAVAILGLGGAAWLYRRGKAPGQSTMFLQKAFYVDQMYAALIIFPLTAIARFIANSVEPVIFEGSITLVARTTSRLAGMLQMLQSGQVRSYIAGFVVGAAALIIYFIR